jgi:signal transduction histidine kinase
MIPRSELASALDEARPVRGAVELALADGVPEGNNGFPNAWLDRNADRLWVATVDGASSVDLSGFPGDTSVPRVRIDDVKVDGVRITAADSIVLPSEANALEIRFTAPALSGVDNMSFRYRLSGHDRDWIESGSARVARYASLAPGHYTFELSGRSRGGVEQRVPLRIAVSVRPKWWETTTSRFLAVAAALLAIWSAFQWLTRRLRARARALQHEIDVREEAERRAADAARDLAHISRLATAGELATSIAHELNQPLAAVVGSAQAAQRLLAGQDNPALERLMGVIVTQSDRAAGVIRMLRGFVAKQQTAETIVSLDGVVADTLRLLQHELTGRGVSVRVVDERRRAAVVRGDPVQLQQVLVNLLLNAAEAMTELPAAQRRVTVLLRSDDDQTVRISVIDAGSGLLPGNLARVFEPFFTTKAGGLGLGLSLSRSIIEAHAGRLWAESEPGRGSAFHILLPVTVS